MKSQQAHPAVFSFELFPPRTEAGRRRLPETVRALAAVRPSHFSVTWGAGGSTQEGTLEAVRLVRECTGLPVAPHLTCVGASRERVDPLLASYREQGIDRLVVLRGDLPATAHGREAPGEFRFAAELVAYIRQRHGGAFRIDVAAYPEMHPQSGSPDFDLARFVDKVRAGADGAITQYFFNPQAYFDFVARCEAAGLQIPIVPGIMPITNAEQLLRFSAACGAEVPRWIRLRLEQYADDRQALEDFGVDAVAALCRQLLDAGAPGLHFYTLNQARPTLRLWRQMGLPVPPDAAAPGQG